MFRSIMLVGLVCLVLAGCGGSQQAVPARTPETIVAAFKAAGLEAETPKPMAVSDYGAAPYVATGVRFLIPSLGEDSGGRAFVGTKEEIQQLRNYYDEMGKASALLFSWVFVTQDGKALVQINGDLPEDEARKYEQALK